MGESESILSKVVVRIKRFIIEHRWSLGDGKECEQLFLEPEKYIMIF